MTSSLVRKQPRTPAVPSSVDVDVAPAAAVAPLAAVVPIDAEPSRPPLHLLLTGLRRRARRAESATSDAIVALVAERAQARADARYRNDEGGADDDGGWG